MLIFHAAWSLYTAFNTSKTSFTIFQKKSRSITIQWLTHRVDILLCDLWENWKLWRNAGHCYFRTSLWILWCLKSSRGTLPLFLVICVLSTVVAMTASEKPDAPCRSFMGASYLSCYYVSGLVRWVMLIWFLLPNLTPFLKKYIYISRRYTTLLPSRD